VFFLRDHLPFFFKKIKGRKDVSFNKALKPERIQPSAVIAPGGDPTAGFLFPCEFNHFLAVLIF